MNIDPYAISEGACTVPVALRYPPAFDAQELLGGQLFTWRAGRNYVRLQPGKSHVIKVKTP